MHCDKALFKKKRSLSLASCRKKGGQCLSSAVPRQQPYLSSIAAYKTSGFWLNCAASSWTPTRSFFYFRQIRLSVTFLWPTCRFFFTEMATIPFKGHAQFKVDNLTIRQFISKKLSFFLHILCIQGYIQRCLNMLQPIVVGWQQVLSTQQIEISHFSYLSMSILERFVVFGLAACWHKAALVDLEGVLFPLGAGGLPRGTPLLFCVFGEP